MRAASPPAFFAARIFLRVRGVSILEASLSLMIAASMAIGVVDYLDKSNSNDASALASAASYQARVTQAAILYLRNNRAKLMHKASENSDYGLLPEDSTQYDGTVRTLGPLTGTRPDIVEWLADGNYLPLDFPRTNTFGQRPCLLARFVGSIDARVEALLIMEGGSEMTSASAGEDFSRRAGVGGGMIYLESGQLVAKGASGTWKVPLGTSDAFGNLKCDSSVGGAKKGHPASFIYDGAYGSTYAQLVTATNSVTMPQDAPVAANSIRPIPLIRNATGDITDNTMLVDFDANGYDVKNANTVSAKRLELPPGSRMVGNFSPSGDVAVNIGNMFDVDVLGTNLLTVGGLSGDDYSEISMAGGPSSVARLLDGAGKGITAESLSACTGNDGALVLRSDSSLSSCLAGGAMASGVSIGRSVVDTPRIAYRIAFTTLPATYTATGMLPCEDGYYALGGGGYCQGGEMIASMPLSMMKSTDLPASNSFAVQNLQLNSAIAASTSGDVSTIYKLSSGAQGWTTICTKPSTMLYIYTFCFNPNGNAVAGGMVNTTLQVGP